MTTDELEPYYVVDRETLDGFEATSRPVIAMLAEMTDDDTAVLAQTVGGAGEVRYVPIILLRNGGEEALVNMAIVDDEQRASILHCLERLATFTQVAYDELEERVPEELDAQTERLRRAIEADAFWSVEQFGELDAALFQLETIIEDFRESSPIAPLLEGVDGLRDAIAAAERGFDLIRVIVYAEEDDGEE